jgi:hypothetical protein
MPPGLRRKRQEVAQAAGELTELMVSRSLRARKGRLRSDLLDSPAVRRRVAVLVKASLSYNADLTAWREATLASRKGALPGRKIDENTYTTPSAVHLG